MTALAIPTVVKLLLRALFRIELDGDLPTAGPTIFVANHLSRFDAAVVSAALGRDFAAIVCPSEQIGSTTTSLAEALDVAGRGDVLVFPEKAASDHGGALMDLDPAAAGLAGARIVPVCITGTEATPFAPRVERVRRRLLPKVCVHVGAPQVLEGTGRAALHALRDVLETVRMDALRAVPSIPHALKLAARSTGGDDPAITDPMGGSFTYRQISIGAAAFAGLLATRTDPGERVGFLLPGAAGTAIALTGLWRAGRVPAILNPTLGPKAMMSAIRTGKIRRILTSRAFVAKADLKPLIENLEAKGVQVLWTEDLKAAIGPRQKLAALWASRRPVDAQITPDSPAVVLFTSGTEGAPKGVVLTHGNILANIAQIRARSTISCRDRVMSALPIFHSFGLTAGFTLPLVIGAPLMIAPSPLHFREVPKAAGRHRATILFGTDTFLRGWAAKAGEMDFANMRAAIAGAEPVKGRTRKLYAQRFGTAIFEGYGATEAGPVIALNTPERHRNGTVGRPMPGIATRLEDVPGVDGQRLFIRGPNIMAGYLMPGDDGVITPADDWYDTGDIVRVDAQGFITIVGRAKRFAKIGGEMVSLAATEELAASVWDEAQVAALAMPCTRKGEKVVLVVDNPEARRDALHAAARQQGVAEILLPAEVVYRADIPVLASGKTDYPELTRMMAS